VLGGVEGSFLLTFTYSNWRPITTLPGPSAALPYSVVANSDTRTRQMDNFTVWLVVQRLIRLVPSLSTAVNRVRIDVSILYPGDRRATDWFYRVVFGVTCNRTAARLVWSAWASLLRDCTVFHPFLANVNSSSRSLYVIGRPSVVCRLSVTFVRPTQAIEIFGNISTPCSILAIHDLCVKILRRSSQGNPSIGGVKHKRVAEYSDFGPIQRYISETVQDRR